MELLQGNPPSLSRFLSLSLCKQASYGIPFSRTKKKGDPMRCRATSSDDWKVGVVVASGGTNLLGSIVASELWLPVIITFQTVAPNHNCDRDMVEDMHP